MKPDIHNSMLLLSPEMRVTRGHLGGVAELADRVRDRYQHWLVSEAPAERVLRANAAGNHWHAGAQGDYSPHFHVELTFAAAAPSLYREFKESTTGIQSILERAERVESIVSPQPSSDRRFESSSQRVTAAAAWPVEQVLPVAHTAAAVPASQAGDRSPVTAPAQTLPKWEWPAPPKSSALAETDVSRLAEQVMRAIDRRATAHRERHGRA